MFIKHTYFILICLGILLIPLSIGTFFVKEGYDDYLNTYFNKVKDLMVNDIDSILRGAKSKAEKKELEACLDSCC